MAKLLQSAGRPLNIEKDGQQFSFSANEDFVEIVHIASRENADCECLAEITGFIHEFFSDFQSPVDSDMYIMLLSEVMKAAHKQTGMTKIQMEILIGSLAECLPKETDGYRRLLGMIK